LDQRSYPAVRLADHVQPAHLSGDNEFISYSAEEFVWEPPVWEGPGTGGSHVKEYRYSLCRGVENYIFSLRIESIEYCAAFEERKNVAKDDT